MRNDSPLATEAQFIAQCHFGMIVRINGILFNSSPSRKADYLLLDSRCLKLARPFV